jgi:hypothetical protein
MEDRRAVEIGAAVAVVASVLLTVAAASLESTVNGPGTTRVAAPVLWGLGGGAGLCAGAVVASMIARRVGPGVLAALFGAVPFLAVVVLVYNDGQLTVGDQVVGSLVVVVLPALIAGVVFACLGMMAGRVGRRRGSRAHS